MEHVLSVRPTEKFPEKVENLKRWARFPGWNFRTEFRVSFTRFSSFVPVPGPRLGTATLRGLRPNGTTREQLFTNRKFHVAPTEISVFFSQMESALRFRSAGSFPEQRLIIEPGPALSLNIFCNWGQVALEGNFTVVAKTKTPEVLVFGGAIGCCEN